MTAAVAASVLTVAAHLGCAAGHDVARRLDLPAGQLGSVSVEISIQVRTQDIRRAELNAPHWLTFDFGSESKGLCVLASEAVDRCV